MRKYYLITGILILLTACAVTNRFQPDARNLGSMQEKVPGVTIGQLQEGMVIYKRNCSSCHQLYTPSSFAQQKWEKTLTKMFPRAKIIDEEVQQKVRQYLYAMSK